MLIAIDFVVVIVEVAVDAVVVEGGHRLPVGTPMGGSGGHNGGQEGHHRGDVLFKLVFFGTMFTIGDDQSF